MQDTTDGVHRFTASGCGNTSLQSWRERNDLTIPEQHSSAKHLRAYLTFCSHMRQHQHL
jgi:hypothetical protein